MVSIKCDLHICDATRLQVHTKITLIVLDSIQFKRMAVNSEENLTRFENFFFRLYGWPTNDKGSFNMKTPPLGNKSYDYQTKLRNELSLIV